MKRLFVIIPLVILLCLTMACQQSIEKGITEVEARAITDQVLKIWNEGNLAIADDLYGPDYVRHHPTPSANASLDDFKETVKANRAVFPDYNLTFDEILINGDKIIIRATMTGTNTSPYGDRRATGKKVRMSGIYVYRIANGKIVEEWTFFNLLSYYQQLGYSLAPPLLEGEE